MVCTEFQIRYWNWVVRSELTLGPHLCVLLQIWDSLSKTSWVQRINIRCLIVCAAANLGFAAEVVLSVVHSHWLPSCVFCIEFRIGCPSCIVSCEFEIRCQNWVVCSELTFGVELGVLQRIWGLLLKLSCLQQINIRNRIVCALANLGIAAEVELSAMNLWFALEIE
jgi:hypothetical protein